MTDVFKECVCVYECVCVFWYGLRLCFWWFPLLKHFNLNQSHPLYYFLALKEVKLKNKLFLFFVLSQIPSFLLDWLAAGFYLHGKEKANITKV